MRTIRAEELEEGDLLEVDGVLHFVTDIRENARMDGCWVEYTTDRACEGAARFYQYDEMVNITTTGEMEAECS